MNMLYYVRRVSMLYVLQYYDRDSTTMKKEVVVVDHSIALIDHRQLCYNIALHTNLAEQ